MKRYLMIVVLSLMFIPVCVLANESYYVNYFGIEMTEEEYNNLLNFGYSEHEIYLLPKEEYEKNKDINAKLEAVQESYYRDVTRYDSLGRVLFQQSTTVSKEEYNEETPPGDATVFNGGYIETVYKKLRTTIAKKDDELYTYKTTLTWKLMPKVRSYDIIGIGTDPHIVYPLSGSNRVFTSYCTDDTCLCDNSYYDKFLTSEGNAFSVQIPTDSSLNELEVYLYFDVFKSTKETITEMYAVGDYAHAVKKVPDSLSYSFYATQGGLYINRADGYYDSMEESILLWTGSW